MFQTAAFPAGEDEAPPASSGVLGGILKSVAKAANENEAVKTALSTVGLDPSLLEEGKEGEALTKMLKGLNIDSTIITNLTSSFTGKEGVTSLMNAFTNPEKLQTLLADKTGMDNETINGFVETIKKKFK